MKNSTTRNVFCSKSPIISAKSAANIQVLYLGEKGKLTYAGSGRAVSKKLSDKLGISKFNFF